MELIVMMGLLDIYQLEVSPSVLYLADLILGVQRLHVVENVKPNY